jgi:hypothetical protein
MVDLVAEDSGAGCMPYAGDARHLRQAVRAGALSEQQGNPSEAPTLAVYPRAGRRPRRLASG